MAGPAIAAKKSEGEGDKTGDKKGEVPEREFFIDNLLVRIHLIIKMVLVDRPCAMGAWIPFSL